MRGFLIAASNMCGYINQIWYSDAVWRTAEAPRFGPGFISAAVFGAAIIVTSLLTRLLESRDERERGVGDRAGDLAVPDAHDLVA